MGGRSLLRECFLQRGTDHRQIEMGPHPLCGELRRENAQRPAGRLSGVAICNTWVGDFPTLQYVATVADLLNIRIDKHLRPKSRSTVAVQFCINQSNALRRLEIQQTRKKFRRFGRIPAGPALSFPGKRPGIGGREWPKAGINRSQNRPITVRRRDPPTG